jgi:hypothetical protein
MDKPKEISVGPMILKIGGKDISLTVDEAKRLKAVLEGVFGKEVREVIKYVDRPYPYKPQVWPYYDYTDYNKFYQLPSYKIGVNWASTK